MKWWICGAKGLVGKTLMKKFKDECIGSGSEVDISKIEDCKSFIQTHGPFKGIINCAAFSKVDLAETHQNEAFYANAIGPEVLGKIAKEHKMFLLHLSTDYVFSGNSKKPLKEIDAPNPCNYYGKTKLDGEQRLETINPNSCILRTSWVFGSGGNNFASLAIEKLQTEDHLKLVSDQISRPTYVNDLADVIWKMKEKSGLYQFANQNEASKYVFANALKEELIKQGAYVKCREIKPCLGAEFPSLALRPQYTPFDTSKIEHEMNIHPRSWQSALSEFVKEAIGL